MLEDHVKDLVNRLLYFEVGLHELDELRINSWKRWTRTRIYRLLRLVQEKSKHMRFYGIKIRVITNLEFEIVSSSFHAALSEVQKAILYLGGGKFDLRQSPKYLGLPTSLLTRKVKKEEGRLFKRYRDNFFKLLTDGIYMHDRLGVLIIQFLLKNITLKKAISEVQNPKNFTCIEGDVCNICGKKISKHDLEELVVLMIQKRGWYIEYSHEVI